MGEFISFASTQEISRDGMMENIGRSRLSFRKICTGGHWQHPPSWHWFHGKDQVRKDTFATNVWERWSAIHIRKISSILVTISSFFRPEDKPGCTIYPISNSTTIGTVRLQDVNYGVWLFNFFNWPSPRLHFPDHDPYKVHFTNLRIFASCPGPPQSPFHPP